MILRVDSLAGTETILTSGARAGLMIRETLEPTSRHFSALVERYSISNSQKLSRFSRFREGFVTTGADGPDLGEYPPRPVWLKITKSGDAFTASYSFDSAQWTEWLYSSTTISSFSDQFYVGMFVAAGSDDVLQARDFMVSKPTVRFFRCNLMACIFVFSLPP